MRPGSEVRAAIVRRFLTLGVIVRDPPPSVTCGGTMTGGRLWAKADSAVAVCLMALPHGRVSHLAY